MSESNQALPGRGIWLTALCGGLADGMLLGRYVAERDAAAFEALVRRHGPMVLGVCRRVTGHEQDAEDAFQATFVVLARRAAAVDPREQVGNWLYGVAYRTAQKARTGAARRRAHERRAAEARATMNATHDDLDDAALVLHGEIARLPTLYRVPIVLCDLEGRPRKEVAAELGIPEGTLSSRLTAGRQRLAAALSRRGVVLSAAGLATVLAETGSACGAVPPSLLEATLRSVEALTVGGQLSAAVAPRVLELADHSTRLFTPVRMKVAVLVLAAVTAAGAAGFALSGPDPAAVPPALPKAGEVADRGPGIPVPAVRPEEQPGLRRQIEAAKWVLSAVDPIRRTVAVTDSPAGGRIVAVPGRPVQPAGLSVEGLPVEADAGVEIDGKPAGLEALRAGMRVSLRLRPGRLAADRVVASTGPIDPAAGAAAYEVVALDPPRRVLSVREPATGLTLDALPLAPDLEVEVQAVGNDPALRETATRAGTVADVKPGTRVRLWLAVGPDGGVAVRKVSVPE